MTNERSVQEAAQAALVQLGWEPGGDYQLPAGVLHPSEWAWLATDPREEQDR